ncbi:MAG: peptidylprolyl isomerase [Rhizobiaceae bacterium]
MTGLILSGCNWSNTSVQGSTSEKPVIADQPLTTGVPEKKLLSGKGGTRIAVLVNDNAITNTDIRRRAAFVKLRRVKGNPTTVAREELIDEAIKMQEARRLNAVVSDQQVNAAFARFAKNNKMPLKALDQIMVQRGVTKRGFKQFIRAQMSWSRVVSARIRSEGSGTAAPSSQRWLPALGSKTTDVKEFTLQQVVFTVPKAERGRTLAAKTAAAKRFRSQVTGCKTTRDLAKNLNNVAVLDLGRIRANRLPPEWRKDVETTTPGRATNVKQTPKGVEMLIVCRARDVKAIDNGLGAFENADLQKKASTLEKQYFAELKKKAVIRQR